MKQKLARLGRYTAFTSVLLGFATFGITFAASSIPQAPSLLNEQGQLGPNFFCPIINVMFWVLIFMSVIMVFWAAFNYLMAGDDTERVHKATKTLTYAAVAVVVALLAKGFPFLIGSIFSSDYSGSLSC